jgi:hypothetical protein
MFKDRLANAGLFDVRKYLIDEMRNSAVKIR